MENITSRCAISTTGTEPYTTAVTIFGELEHQLINDVPPGEGGQGKGPTPHEMLEAAVASCKAITVRMYADRKKWPLESVTAKVRHQLRPKEEGGPKVHHFDAQVQFTGDLTDEQRHRLHEISGRCSIQKILQSETVFESDLDD
ncbi:MAG: osmotically inducible protein OsmC [Phycisphaera sp.]|nr:MAG: osmotically inducible protein OsmC [Phycisphaera sp.]